MRSALAGWLIAGLLGTAPAWAQATKAAPKRTAPMENVTLTTKDGVSLKATYFASTAGKDSPVAVLLHGKSGNRLVWQTGLGQIGGLAQWLQQNGFAVLTVDLRKHGENLGSAVTPANKKAEPTALKPNDYQAMVAGDMEAVKKFLYDEHQKEKLNMSKLALVGAEFSANVALVYTELDWSKTPYDDAPVPAQRTPRGQDVRALVLISPDGNTPGLKTTETSLLIRELRNSPLRIHVLVAVGGKDTNDRGTTKRLADSMQPSKEDKSLSPYVFVETYDTKYRGTDLLGKNLKLESHIGKFLDDHVKKLDIPWRSRKSNIAD
jgi:pimeloyl-ACP methyl ester carboxylesterase